MSSRLTVRGLVPVLLTMIIVDRHRDWTDDSPGASRSATEPGPLDSPRDG